MPELPEVETVVRGLRKTVLHKTMSQVIIDAPQKSIVVSPSFKNKSFGSIIKNKTIEKINRRGKNILIELSGDITLWVHLKMTGHFYYKINNAPKEKHDLVIFKFKKPDNRNKLIFNDYRRFGRLRLFYSDEIWDQKGLKELGAEPLEISSDDFIKLCKSKKRMIKPALLDQKVLAGIGNIYADESLYASKIHPKRIMSSLSKKKLFELHGHIQRILSMAIDNMGSSVDTYTGVNGEAGKFQNYLKAYGNKGKNCVRCKKIIIREKIGSRSAHYCPKCQKM